MLTELMNDRPQYVKIGWLLIGLSLAMSVFILAETSRSYWGLSAGFVFLGPFLFALVLWSQIVRFTRKEKEHEPWTPEEESDSYEDGFENDSDS